MGDALSSGPAGNDAEVKSPEFYAAVASANNQYLAAQQQQQATGSVVPGFSVIRPPGAIDNSMVAAAALTLAASGPTTAAPAPAPTCPLPSDDGDVNASGGGKSLPAAATSPAPQRKKPVLPKNNNTQQKRKTSEDQDSSSTPNSPLEERTKTTEAADKSANGSAKKKRNDLYLVYYPQLIEHKKKYGHVNIDTRAMPGLSKFIRNCKKEYESIQEGKASDLLTPERIAQLDELGFSWKLIRRSLKLDQTWDDRFAELVEFQKTHGHCQVNAQQNADLAHFVQKMRSYHTDLKRKCAAGEDPKPKVLTPERIEKLNSIGFEFVSNENGPTNDSGGGQSLPAATSSAPQRKNPALPENSNNTQQKRKTSEDQGSSSTPNSPAKKRTNATPGADESPNDSAKKKRNDLYLVYYPQLVEHKKKHGHVNVDSREMPGLAKFIRNCKKEFKSIQEEGKTADLLTPERTAQLDELGISWKLVQRPLKLDQTWDERFAELVEFQKKHGHCLVGAQENADLAHFVQKMRGYYRDLKRKRADGDDPKPKVLTPERMEKLTSIGFEFVVTKTNNTQRKRKTSEGQDTSSSSPAKKRTKATPGADKSPNESVKKKRQDLYLVYYPQMVKYKKKNGHINVDSRDMPGLAKFIRNCKVEYESIQEEGKTSELLTPERITQLNELGISWKLVRRSAKLDQTWDERFAELVEFQKTHGHCRVNTRQETDLAHFVQKMRSYHKDLKRKRAAGEDPKPKVLTPERMEKLNSIGFEFRVWKNPIKSWEDRFLEVQDFKSSHGHTVVPPSFDENLHHWCKAQRKGYRRYMAMVRADNERKRAARNDPEGKVPDKLEKEYQRLSKVTPMPQPEQLLRLHSIDFEFNPIKESPEDAWENHYKALVEFKEQHGHTRVSRNYQENLRLGGWVKWQRRYMTRKVKGLPGSGPLTDERIRRLDKIGFEWRLKPIVVDGGGSDDDEEDEEDDYDD